ncbi:hypothetical protein [Teichococcus rhizosphaerae]|uniref:hypothetical protein n=1 Tax=Teichococcus rhizosphaerae TaxID=1335062 RepID=UPI00159BA86B|nr:hypothetical protein [Pseudoroseomonas rhizosphaerae]
MAEQDKKTDAAPKIGEMTSMLTGNETKDAETTRPGSKNHGAGEVGNLLKNQKEK